VSRPKSKCGCGYCQYYKAQGTFYGICLRGNPMKSFGQGCIEFIRRAK